MISGYITIVMEVVSRLITRVLPIHNPNCSSKYSWGHVYPPNTSGKHFWSKPRLAQFEFLGYFYVYLVYILCVSYVYMWIYNIYIYINGHPMLQNHPEPTLYIYIYINILYTSPNPECRCDHDDHGSHLNFSPNWNPNLVTMSLNWSGVPPRESNLKETGW